MTGGIMSLANYKGFTVNIRPPRWTDSKLWINSEDFEAAQFIADAARFYTGRYPVHFPDAKFVYLPLPLISGEILTTREKCAGHVAKIAKGSTLLDQRRDYKERVHKLILEMVRSPEVVECLNILRASPRQVSQPRPEANIEEDTHSPFTEDENGMAMEVDTLSEAIQALPLMVTVNPSQNGNLVPVAIPEEETHSVTTDDGGEENGTPMEVDSLSEETVQALAPAGTVDPASVFFESTMTSFYMDFDISTSYIPSFEMDLDEPENFLSSAGQSLGVWHRRFSEKEKEGLVPDNCKEFLASLDKGEEEAWKSTEPSDWEPWSPPPPFVPYSPLLGTTLPGSGWQSPGTTSGADANEALRPRVRPILCQNRWRP